MMRNICPICDQVMNNGHYCRNCRSFVRRPYRREVNYYLNERHPARERRCDGYGDPCAKSAGDRHHQPANSNPPLYARPPENGSARVPERPPAGRAPGRPGGAPVPAGQRPGPVVTGREVKSSDPLKYILAAVAGVVIIFAVCVSIIGSVFYNSKEGAGIEGDADFGDFYDGADGGFDLDEYYVEDSVEYEELDDETVKAAGIRCNRFNHFNMDMGKMDAGIRMAVQTLGYTIDTESNGSYNDRQTDEDGEWTCYSSDRTFYVSGHERGIAGQGEQALQWVSLGYDTATGELHCYESQLQDSALSVQLLMEFVRKMEAAYQVREADSLLDELASDAQIQIQTQGYYGRESELFSIGCEDDQDGVYMSVYCNEED